MAERAITRSRFGGFAIDIEGLERLGADLEHLGRDGIKKAIRRSLRGAGGEALAAEQRLRAPVGRGGLVAGIGVHQDGLGGDVLVGYRGDLPKGEWAESGVKPHLIQPKVTRRGGQRSGALSFDGGAWANALHPGYRGKKVAARSMKAAEWEVLADVVDEINRETGAA
jgi:hypothetical protein